MVVEMLGFDFPPNEFRLVAVIRASSKGEWALIRDIIHVFALDVGNF